MIPTLRSHRIILRPFKLRDTYATNLLLSDDDILDSSHYIEKTNEFIKQNIYYAEYGFPIYAITLEKHNDLVGGVGLFSGGHHHDKNNLIMKNAGLWFFIFKPYRGNGYCFEAASHVINYAKKYLLTNNISTRVKRKNKQSISVCKRLGFKEEDGTIKIGSREGYVSDACCSIEWCNFILLHLNSANSF